MELQYCPWTNTAIKEVSKKGTVNVCGFTIMHNFSRMKLMYKKNEVVRIATNTLPRIINVIKFQIIVIVK